MKNNYYDSLYTGRDEFPEIEIPGITQEEKFNFTEIAKRSVEELAKGKGLIKPDPAIKERLDKRFARKHLRVADIVSSVIHYRIPLYRAAFITAIIFCFAVVMDFNSVSNSSIIHKYDTVYLEKPAVQDISDSLAEMNNDSSAKTKVQRDSSNFGISQLTGAIRGLHGLLLTGMDFSSLLLNRIKPGGLQLKGRGISKGYVLKNTPENTFRRKLN